ncbi:MAG: hypothetical protein CML66_18885 [Rhodobacteraceae bacterium]|nr:hypothetical protein [Paracoccaceae bacterium]MAY45516.1 hypothetical protein [Paracoccaceae bacterium]
MTTLPWPAVAILLGTTLGAAGLAALLGPAAAIPALFGAVAGLGGAFVSPGDRSLGPVMAGLVTLGLLLVHPSVPVLWLIALGLCALAGLESVRSGGRAIVLVIYACLGLHLIAAMPPIATSAPVAGAAMLVGWGVARITGLAGQAAQPPGPPFHGVMLALYLAIGLALALLVMHLMKSPFAHWVALIFIMRALAPLDMTTRTTLQFGLGATIGCLAAMALIAIGPPKPVLLALCVPAVIAALRLLPHPRPWTPALISAAVLFLVAPSVADALVRLEVTLIVVLLSVALSTGLGLLLDDDNGLARRFGRKPAG